jgi:hypothetical protein
MGYSSGVQLPQVEFSTIDSTEIPVGSYFVGFDLDNGGKLSKMDNTGNITVIEGGEGVSPLQRVDVVSFGVNQGVSSFGVVQQRIFSVNNIKPLLWEIVGSAGNKLETELSFSNILSISEFISAIDEYSVDQNLEITVRGYYYVDNSKEKFRLVGKNAAYWSLVGINNYGRIDGGRAISPETLGQSIITALQDYGIPIGNNGEGLIFTSQKGSSFGRPTVHGIILSGKTYTEYYGINGVGNPVSLDSMVIDAYWQNDIKYIRCSRADVMSIEPSRHGLDGSKHGLLEYSRFILASSTHPLPNGLSAWLVKPIGHDTILLSNNYDIENDDEVFVVPERVYDIPYLSKVEVYSQIDDQGLGEDLTASSLKTSKDRFGSIRTEEIPYKSTRVSKNKKNGIKYRVAYGKNGIYTVSQDYISFIGNSAYSYGLVNRES